MRAYKRRILIINKGYQWRFIVTFLCLCLIGIAMSFLSVMYMVNAGLEEGMYKSHITVSGAQQIVLPIAARANLALLFAGGMLLAGVSLFFARRTQIMVDGFREGLGMLRKGRLDFCFNDESRHDFPELDYAFNTMASKNRARIKRLKAALDGMADPIGKLADNEGSCPREKAAALTEIRAGLDELFGTLDEFKL